MQRLLAALVFMLCTWAVPTAPAFSQGYTDSVEFKCAKGDKDACAISAKKCDAGDMNACEYAANWARNPNNPDANPAVAGRLYDKACRAKRFPACKVAIENYAKLADYKSIYAVEDAACNAGQPDYCFKAGMAAQRGLGVRADPALAKSLFQKAISLIENPGGNDTHIMSTLDTLAVAFLRARLDRLAAPNVKRVTPTTPDGIKQVWQCDQGEGTACHQIGLAYAQGNAVPQNDVVAVEFFEDGCDRSYYAFKRSSKACHNSGVAYSVGRGVKPDGEKAFRYHTSACSMQESRGCTQLGLLYVQGFGAVKNPDRAFANFQKGCSGRDPYGCRLLGLAYEKGVGVAADTAEAKAAYREAQAMTTDPQLTAQLKEDLARIGG